MKNVQQTQPSEFTLQLMEKAARLQSSPQLNGSSSLSNLKKDNDFVTDVYFHLTENVYKW